MKKIIRVFPRKTNMTPTDSLALVGDPPMFYLLPEWQEVDEVHVSVTFTWDIEQGKRLVMAWSQYHPLVYIGGPAFGDHSGSFTPGRYVKAGVTFTSRGCNWNCPWCLVPKREGRLRELTDFPAGNIVQDNNLLQCSKEHIRKVFDMLKTQHTIDFSGGLDSRLVTDEVAYELRSLRVRQLFLSVDSKEALRSLEKAIERLKGFSRRQLRCYVLIGFHGETIDEARERLEAVWQLGAMPFAQLYQPPDRYINYPREWRNLARTWSRPAAMKAIHCYHNV